MPAFVKESTVGEIISDTFRIFGGNLGLLFLIALMAMGPFELLKALGISAGDEALAGIGGLLSALASFVVYGAITVAVSDVCLGNRPTLKRSYAAIGRVLGKYVGAYVLLMLILGIGFVLLVIPGLIAWTFLFFTLPAVVIERKGAIAAMKRSIALGKGSYWRNLGVLILATLVILGFTMLAYMIVGGAGAAAGGEGTEFVFVLAVGLIGILVTPLAQIPLVLLYYDMRARKEYFDGSALEQEMFA